MSKIRLINKNPKNIFFDFLWIKNISRKLNKKISKNNGKWKRLENR